ncbi:MAG: hypothetical protein R3C28_10760 [Pirellulaceae bacterium]
MVWDIDRDGDQDVVALYQTDGLEAAVKQVRWFGWKTEMTVNSSRHKRSPIRQSILA